MNDRDERNESARGRHPSYYVVWGLSVVLGLGSWAFAAELVVAAYDHWGPARGEAMLMLLMVVGVTSGTGILLFYTIQSRQKFSPLRLQMFPRVHAVVIGLMVSGASALMGSGGRQVVPALWGFSPGLLAILCGVLAETKSEEDG